MDGARFDRLTRLLSTGSSRRSIVPRLAAASLSLGMASRLSELTTAKKAKKKNKKKKLKRNAFGCVNVGKPCRGKDKNCCSGICQGKKPKKGKKDKSKCVGHDEGACPPGQTTASCGGVDVACVSGVGEPGLCVTTTGNASYCYGFVGCFPCQKDADCLGVCGPGAACILCAQGCAPRGLTTACASPADFCPSLPD